MSVSKGGAAAAANGRPWPERLTGTIDAARYPYRLALAALGLIASIYLTWLHYASGVPIACPEGGVINCLAVITSPESTLLGIPVAVFGLVFFLGALALVLWRRRGAPPLASFLALTWMVGGFAVVVVLVWTELFVVDRICLWCTFTHVMALSLFALELWPAPAPPPKPDIRAAQRRTARA